MTGRGEIVFDPERGKYVSISPIKIDGRRPFLRTQNPSTFRGRESPRLGESHAAFTEINYNTFGKKVGPDGKFPRWRAL